jgi:hypothetical protein
MRIRRLLLFMKHSETTRKALKTLMKKQQREIGISESVVNKGANVHTGHSQMIGQPRILTSVPTIVKVDHLPTIETTAYTVPASVPAETSPRQSMRVSEKLSEDELRRQKSSLQEAMRQLENEEIRLITAGIELEAAYANPAETIPRKLSEDDLLLQKVMKQRGEKTHTGVRKDPFMEKNYYPERPRTISRDASQNEVCQGGTRALSSSLVSIDEISDITSKSRSMSHTELFQEQFFPEFD